MGVSVLMDLILLALLMYFVWRGGKRGLVLGLAGLLSLLIAFAGAGYIASHYSGAVSEKLKPHFTQLVEQKLKESGETSASSGETDEQRSDHVSQALSKMGLYNGVAKTITEGVTASVKTVGKALTDAVAESLSGTAAYILLFFVAFVIILLILKLLAHALNLCAKLPGLHFLNAVGGGLLGLVEGMLILFLAAWILRFMGKVIPEDVVNGTVLLKFFLQTNPVTLFSGI